MKNKFLLIATGVSVLALSGCVGQIKTNEDIAMIDSQTARVKDHIQNLAKTDGVYRNDQLDFSLLNNVKAIVLQRSDKLFAQKEDGKIDEAVLNQGTQKATSVLFFVWMENFDAAFNNRSVEAMQRVRDEAKSFAGSKNINEWLKKSGKLSKYEYLSGVMDEMTTLINNSNQIDANNSKLTEMKKQMEDKKNSDDIAGYNKMVPAYNELVDNNQKLIDEYNQKVSQVSPQYVYDAFMALVDVDMILPGQKSMNLKK